MVATYFGYTWWDNEADGDAMYPKQQHNPSEEERYEIAQRNPEGAARARAVVRSEVSGADGHAGVQREAANRQFADFHGHGWLFPRGLLARPRGPSARFDGKGVSFTDPDKFAKAVHLEDIHLEKGMHCVDCHFEQDSHGNGKLYGEPRAAIELDCTDCHGTIAQRATLRTSGPRRPPAARRSKRCARRGAQRRFEWRDGKLYQRSVVEQGKEWEVVQTLDSITPGNPHYSEKSRLAKTLRTDGRTWGDVPADETQLAHANSSMTCYACHTSWTPNCFGCHLEMRAQRSARRCCTTKGSTTRNWTSYNFQVLRDDGYMLGVDGTVTGHRVAPARSSCAILVSSQNQNRDWLYYTQQTVSAEGFSGQAFSTYVPHTVRARETKELRGLPRFRARDNNAWMAMLLLQGTNLLNYMGRYVYVADGQQGLRGRGHGRARRTARGHRQRPAAHGLSRRLPQASGAQARADDGVLGTTVMSSMCSCAANISMPRWARGGFRIYDVANIDNKDFSERMVTAPVSPLGQRLYVKTRDAMAVATPTTLAVDPLREHHPGKRRAADSSDVRLSLRGR